MLKMFLKVAHEVWPMIFIFTVIIVTIRITYLILNRQKLVLYKELTTFCFIIYILLLYYIVTFQDNNYGVNNFIPFKEIFRYKINSSLFFKNVVGNIFLFIPFGIFVTNYVKNKTILPTLFISCLISCSIEFAQSAIGRTLDIDDVILNTIGGIIGYLIYKFVAKSAVHLPKFMKQQIFLDILSLILILVIIYLAFKYEFWRIIL